MRAVLYFRTLSHCQLVQRLLQSQAARGQASGPTAQMWHSAEFYRDLQHQTLHIIKRSADDYSVIIVNYTVCVLLLIAIRLVNEIVTVKTVNWFPTGNWFPERITGYQIYGTSRHNLGNADGGVWPLPGCTCVSAYPHCAAVSAVSCRFLAKASVVGSFGTSVLVAGRLSTGAIHVCCPNIWTVLYFWMMVCKCCVCSGKSVHRSNHLSKPELCQSGQTLLNYFTFW